MKALVIPPYLDEGDLITIVTPASHIDQDPVLKAVKMLEKSGFRVKLGEHVFTRNGPFSGSDDERLLDLQKATDDREVKAILCSRGGYGMSRIVDRIDYSRAEAASQVVCRLQRYHLAAPVAQYGMRYRIASC